MARKSTSSSSKKRFKICRAGFSKDYHQLVGDILVQFKDGRYDADDAEVIKALTSASYCEEVK